MLLDRIGPPRRCRGGVVMIYWFRRPRVNLIHHPLTRARAVMARPWSAGCYGVARQREGSRQNSIGGSGVLSLRHFGLAGWFSLSVGAWVPKESGAAKIGFGRRDAARPARAAWAVQAARWKGRWRRRRRFSLVLLISGPRVNLFHQPYAREGADGQAVVCPLLRG